MTGTWKPCPTGATQWRWHDGERWTRHVAPASPEPPTEPPADATERRPTVITGRLCTDDPTPFSPVPLEGFTCEPTTPTEPHTQPTGQTAGLAPGGAPEGVPGAPAAEPFDPMRAPVVGRADGTPDATWTPAMGSGVGGGAGAHGILGQRDRDPDLPSAAGDPLDPPRHPFGLPVLTAARRVPWRSLVAPATIVLLLVAVVVNAAHRPPPATAFAHGFAAAVAPDTPADTVTCLARRTAGTPSADWAAAPVDDRARMWAAAGDCFDASIWDLTAPATVDTLRIPLDAAARSCVARRLPGVMTADAFARLDPSATTPYSAPGLAEQAAAAVDGCTDLTDQVTAALAAAGVAGPDAACTAAALIAGRDTATVVAAGGLHTDPADPHVAEALTACTAPSA